MKRNLHITWYIVQFVITNSSMYHLWKKNVNHDLNYEFTVLCTNYRITLLRLSVSPACCQTQSTHVKSYYVTRLSSVWHHNTLHVSKHAEARNVILQSLSLSHSPKILYMGIFQSKNNVDCLITKTKKI